jgi:hypothetical protein
MSPRAFQLAARCPCFERPELGDGRAGLGVRHFFAVRHGFQETRKIGFRGVDIDGFHGLPCQDLTATWRNAAA